MANTLAPTLPVEPAKPEAPPRDIVREITKAIPPRDIVCEIFGAGGVMSQKFAAYQSRLGQVEMAYEANAAMEDGGHLLCEAPTGVGKSLAYGVPASYWAGVGGEKVMIVTANIALQEQLVKKDMPLIRDIVPWSFTFELAKGINNYLCKARYDESVNEIVKKSFDGTPEQFREWEKASRWASTTTTGDITELDFELSSKVRRKLTVMSEECLGPKCHKFDECPAMAARRAIKEADVVITNYALFFADLSIKRNGGNGILPKYQHVVFDEAHKAADAARGFFGFRFARGSLLYAVGLLDGASGKRGEVPEINGDLKRKIVELGDKLFAELTLLFHSEQYKIRFRGEWPQASRSAALDLCEALGDASREYNEFPKHGLTAERVQDLANHATKCRDYSSHLRAASGGERNGKWVFFMEEENDQVVLKGLPISVAEYLRDTLFEPSDREVLGVKSVTMTSATLATSIGDFEFVRNELGVPRGVAEVTVESPFDLESKMLMVCPRMPEPSSPRFVEALATRIADIIEQANGRCLCLFTSHYNMREVFKRVVREVPHKIIMQGQKPRMQLIDEFKRETHTVLFGTQSFWAGVDVPGESLSVVVLDKLPFPSFVDPLQDTLRDKHGKQYFGRISVPLAVIEFRQGVGRLIRSSEDRGVVVVLDPRIVEKGYGKTFINALPRGVKVERDTMAIAEFLG